MNNEIEIGIENYVGDQKYQISFDLPLGLKEANESESETLNVPAILNIQNAPETAPAFLNNKNNIVFNCKEVNISCGLSELPKVLFNLKYLSVLNLSNNLLESLPKEIGNLCNLTVLKLSGNRLYCLPKSLKFLHQLSYLDISHNKFSQVPDVLYYGLRSLKVLDLSSNEIATFNDFPACLNKLVVLKMSNNMLKELPLWVFHNLCQLPFLYLSENCLNLNTYCDNYCNSGIFRSLYLLNIENCTLKYGSIQILSLFKNLNEIQMGNTAFAANNNSKGRNYMGNLKSDIFKNCKKLKCLFVQNTQIASLPSDFDCLANVEVLDLSCNLLSWLPECFCNLINLKIVNLTSNQLLFLPNNIDKLINLREIHLGNNKLYHIPESFSNLKNLEFVDLYNNQIESIDPNIFKQSHLKGIDLGLNCLLFDFCGCNVKIDEIRVLYNTKKDSFRNHFSNLGIRSDLQNTNSDGGFDDRNSDARSFISSFENDLSDLDDLPLNIDERSYCEEEDWAEEDSNTCEEDELFDPNEVVKFGHRSDFWSSLNSDFRDNYCPAKGHLPSALKTYVRNFASCAKNETVEDGQFDSD